MSVDGLFAALDLLSTGLLAGMLLVALWNLAAAPRLERAGEPGETPLVSLLVPARNEEANLRALLPRLLATDYPRLEIVVLDDGSDDGTAEVAAAFARERPERLKVMRGEALPEGWLGKNWACWQLARRARGNVLLFCDADVLSGPHAIRRTVALLQAYAAGAATALPRHRLATWGEAAVVPLVAQLPVLATLPLPLVPRAAAPSLSMANGQWLAFTRAAYDAAGGHAAVRGEVLEDVALGRLAKRRGVRLVAAVAADDLSVRMYDGLPAVRAGFRKNLYALLGGAPLAFALAIGIFLLTMVYPWAAALRGTPAALAALGLLVALRLAGAALFRHPWTSVLLHPAGALLAVAIALESVRSHARGTAEWKGRSVAAVEGG